MSSGGTRTLFFSTDNGSTYETFNSPVLPDYRGVSDVTFDHLGMAYCSSTGQGGTPALFTVSPPFTANSTFTPVAGLAGSLFKMTWDECGYLYIYRAGGILKSSVPLRLPEVSCSVSSTSTQWTQNDIEVSPNPATDELYIRATDNSLMRVEIWNMSGQLMMESMLSGETTLHITDLCTGMYTLKFIQADQAVLCRKKKKK